METVLVVVYSRTGRSLRLAQRLCNQLGWSLGEIREIEPRRGAGGRLRRLWDSLLRRCPGIEYRGPSPRDFDLVVLISPLWAYRIAAPMRSFLTLSSGSMPEVAVISVAPSRGASGAVAEVGKRTGRVPRLSAAFTRDEIDDGSCTPRLFSFANTLRRMPRTPRHQRPSAGLPLQSEATRGIEVSQGGHRRAT
ncbi:MAG TPA: flavodoxin [Burkholderiaceae bacterium]